MLVAIFRQFFLLGCMSFGGPAAHLGYFKRHFVDTLNWLSDTRYAQLISLSQALPGPGSSQVGFAIGVERAGVIGGITAFIAFTLPSFLIMLLYSAWAFLYLTSPPILLPTILLGSKIVTGPSSGIISGIDIKASSLKFSGTFLKNSCCDSFFSI